jgi:hypothetical protein
MGTFWLLVDLAILVVNYWAVTRIISQAGYSPAWIALPLLPLVLTIVAMIMLYHDLRGFAFGLPFGSAGTVFIAGLSGDGVVWSLDALSIFVTWVFFLVFAFTRWPVTVEAESASRGSANSPPPGGAPQYGRQVPGPRRPSGSVAPSPIASGTTESPSGAADSEARHAAPSASATSSTGPAPARVKRCAWCGESLPGSRALFHDCGSKDRTVTHCTTCGAQLPSEGAPCPLCS